MKGGLQLHISHTFISSMEAWKKHKPKGLEISNTNPKKLRRRRRRRRLKEQSREGRNKCVVFQDQVQCGRRMTLSHRFLLLPIFIPFLLVSPTTSSPQPSFSSHFLIVSFFVLIFIGSHQESPSGSTRDVIDNLSVLRKWKGPTLPFPLQITIDLKGGRKDEVIVQERKDVEWIGKGKCK